VTSSSSSLRYSSWAAAISSSSSKSGNGYLNIAATPETCWSCCQADVVKKVSIW
jgi:hypothetical protein